MRGSITSFGKRGLPILVVVGLVGFVGQSFAQGQGHGQGQNSNSIVEKRVVIVSRDEDSGKGKKPEKPGRPENPPPSADVQNLVKEFKQARETYLEQQKELARQVKENSKEARELVREQNKELLEQLKEQQRLLRQEARDRARDLKKELHPDMDRVIDSGVGEGRER